ncbi:MAG: hypothetical protein ACP5VP_10745 [Candidatus Limnocylindrales bacterium]
MPPGFLAALMIVYWSGFQTLVNVYAAVFVGLAVFVWYCAPNEGWIRPNVGAVLGVVFVVLLAVALILFSIVLRRCSNPIGRMHIERSAWLMAMLLATFPISRYGEYGPLRRPPLGFPSSDLVVIAVGIVGCHRGVASGFVTEELRAIPGVPMETPGRAPRAPEVGGTGAPPA